MRCALISPGELPDRMPISSELGVSTMSGLSMALTQRCFRSVSLSLKIWCGGPGPGGTAMILPAGRG